MLTGETEALGGNCDSATLSTEDPAWTGLGLNPILRGEGPATNRSQINRSRGESDLHADRSIHTH
jgi:hypothetical protein